MRKINYDLIRVETDRTRAIDLANQELSHYTPDNPPSLSDIFVNINRGGQALLIALAEQETAAKMGGGSPFRWRILVKRDEWGNEPVPGENVERVTPVNRKTRDHNPVPSAELNSAMIDGSFSERFERITQYPVDPKGCITCTFSDASYFLFNWGFHFRTGRGLCNKPEHSQEPVKSPGGDMLHVWYWRYTEVDAEQHGALPERTVTEPAKKRGRPKTA